MRAPDADAFARVYDLGVARARRAARTEPVIPVSVLDEMERAARTFLALQAQGHELRFERDRGRVRAELRTVDGVVVRPVSLREAVDVGGRDPNAAA